MEDVEIDLRPLLRAVIRSWRFIGVAALLMALIVGGMSALRAPLYIATAQMVFVPQQTQVDLKSNVKDQPTQADPGRVQASLLTLAANGGVVQDVITALGAQISPSLRQPTDLQKAIRVDAAGTTNVLQVHITTASAEESKAIATAWSVAFAKLANNALAQHSASQELSAELDQARQTYATKQQQLSSSSLDQEVNRLRRQTNDLKVSINTLQFARLQIISDTLAAQTSTQATLLSEYTTNFLSGQNTPLEAARKAQVAQMTNLYSNTNRLTQLRDDVIALRDQVQKGSTSGTALAYNLLKAQLFAGSTELSGKLQLQMPVADVPTVSDLDALVATTDSHLKSTRDQIAALTTAFQNGTAYVLPSSDALKQAHAMRNDTAPPTAVVNLLNEQLVAQTTLLANDPKMDELEANYQKYASELGLKEQQLFVLTQERDLAKANYTSLSTRLTELQVATANDDAVVRVAGQGAVSSLSSGTLRIAMLGFVIGLLLATLFVVLRTLLRGLLTESAPLVSQRNLANE